MKTTTNPLTLLITLALAGSLNVARAQTSIVGNDTTFPARQMTELASARSAGVTLGRSTYASGEAVTFTVSLAEDPESTIGENGFALVPPQVTVTCPNGDTMQAEVDPLSWNDCPVYSGMFQLPADAEAGVYTLTASSSGGAVSAEFTVVSDRSQQPAQSVPTASPDPQAQPGPTPEDNDSWQQPAP